MSDEIFTLYYKPDGSKFAERQRVILQEEAPE